MNLGKQIALGPIGSSTPLDPLGEAMTVTVWSLVSRTVRVSVFGAVLHALSRLPTWI